MYMNQNDIVQAVLHNEELLKRAVQCFSPHLLIFPKGSPRQQEQWRIDEFIAAAPELFKPIMSIPKRRKAAKAVREAVSQKYIGCL